jgi:hypothetical protein
MESVKPSLFILLTYWWFLAYFTTLDYYRRYKIMVSNDELETKWKKTAEDYFKVLSTTIEKDTEDLHWNRRPPVKIRTQAIHRTKQALNLLTFLISHV